MSRRGLEGKGRVQGGFTLLELLAATAMFAVIIVALYSVFYGALRLRERAAETFETQLPKEFSLSLLKRDLADAVAPTGVLAGSFLGEKREEGRRRLDRLEIHTASARVDEHHPWGDIQRVEFSAIPPEGENDLSQIDLVRAVTRNLLASTEEEPQEAVLLTGIQCLEFSYYDGETWQDSWDSTTQENTLPLAVRVWLEFLPAESEDNPPPPVEMVISIAAGTRSDTQAVEQSAGGMGGGAGR